MANWLQSRMIMAERHSEEMRVTYWWQEAEHGSNTPEGGAEARSHSQSHSPLSHSDIVRIVLY